MMTEMKLPACYAVIDENEMTYLDGGATIADSDAYKAFLNVGQVFKPAGPHLLRCKLHYQQHQCDLQVYR